jgi:hypothetical protein
MKNPLLKKPRFERARIYPCHKASNIRPALQRGEKLYRSPILQGFVTGYDFSHADKANKIAVGL